MKVATAVLSVVRANLKRIAAICIKQKFSTKAEILLFLIPHISLHLHKVEIVNSQIIVRNMHFI